jgi:FdhE protein
MTFAEWLRAHPFLDPVARLLAPLDAAVARVVPLPAAQPQWSDYAGDHKAGVPLLHSANAAIDLAPAGQCVLDVVDALAAAGDAGALAADVQRLARELDRGPGAAQRVADWLLGENVFATSAPGLLRYAGWRTLARALAPLLRAFAQWRDDEQWLRAHCPACGSPPAMAALVPGDPARKRYLCCGCCGGRWRVARSTCPFCEHDGQRVSVLAVEGARGLRVDSCDACRGYLKTWDGTGDETVLLADWTSLHLDVLAVDRGLERRAASLYGLDALLGEPPVATR